MRGNVPPGAASPFYTGIGMCAKTRGCRIDTLHANSRDREGELSQIELAAYLDPTSLDLSSPRAHPGSTAAISSFRRRVADTGSRFGAPPTDSAAQSGDIRVRCSQRA
jgi:hypothetical protein